MQQREKTLLFALVGVLVLAGGYMGVNKYIVKPVAERKTRIKDLQNSIDSEDAKEMRIMQAKRQMQAWTARSLPPDARDAQRLYRDWITSVATYCNFRELKVTPNSGRIQKAGSDELYEGIPVNITGYAKLSEVTRFLHYIHRTDLLHRVTYFKVDSPSNEGNPELKLSVQIEALSLRKAAERDRMFPAVQIAEPFSAGTLTIADAGDFPKQAPFRIRLSDDLLTVQKIDGKQWKVAPGMEPGAEPDAFAPREYPKDAQVELVPLAEPAEGSPTLADMRREFYGPGKSPFTLPEPPVEYRPSFRGVGSQVVYRGGAIDATVSVSDYNPARGKPVLKMVEAPQGVTFDPASGRVTWTPADDLPAGDYSIKLAATQGTAAQPISSDQINVALRDPNRPPVLAEIPAQTVYLGNTLSFSVQASDPDRHRLTFSLKDAPEGAGIDARSGEFTWSPAETVEPRDYSFDVVVTDDGRPETQTTSRNVTVTVREDTASYTYLIRNLVGRNPREAWLYDRSSRQLTTIREGAPFAVSGIEGFVLAVGEDFVLYISNGRTLRLKLGRHLRQALPVAAGSMVPSGNGRNTASK